MALLSGTNTFVPQDNEYNLPFFTKVDLANESPLPLPAQIKNDIVGIINSIGHKAGVNKFLFEGKPGTGKTETVKQIARILDRELYIIDFDTVIDSKLGQTSKNMSSVFMELRNLSQPEKAIILFDEIDAIALDRINSNDLREMGRVTSSMLKGLDGLSDNIILIATTNLFWQFDKALLRRFDSVVNFNRYSKDELIEVAESILNHFITRFKFAGRNMRLFRKIFLSIDRIPYPGDLKNVIKTSLAFSDPNNEYDYLKKLYESIDPKNDTTDLKALQNNGFTVREIEILTGVSKSQVSRELN
jgi:SpoVK/Ycf46/Vps4 family AAA+-type ATPase